MAAWPENGSTNWNDTMKAFIDVEHNADGTHNISAVCAKMYLGTAQAVTNASEEDIVLDTVSFETTTGICSTSTGRITPGTAGYYFVCGTGSLSSMGADKQIVVRIYKNTTLIDEQRVFNSLVGASLAIKAGTHVYLSASDYVKIAVYNGDSSTRNTLSGISVMNLSIHKIGV
jgi:hypothetical protein